MTQNMLHFQRISRIFLILFLMKSSTLSSRVVIMWLYRPDVSINSDSIIDSKQKGARLQSRMQTVKLHNSSSFTSTSYILQSQGPRLQSWIRPLRYARLPTAEAVAPYALGCLESTKKHIEVFENTVSPSCKRLDIGIKEASCYNMPQ